MESRRFFCGSLETKNGLVDILVASLQIYLIDAYPIGSTKLVYLPRWMIDFYGKCMNMPWIYGSTPPPTKKQSPTGKLHV